MKLTDSIAWVGAFAFVGFFWMLSNSGPSDYVICLNKCTDGWGRFYNKECPEMCLPLSEHYQPHKSNITNIEYTFDHEYWYNNGTGRTLDDIDPEILNETINSFKERIEEGTNEFCYYPPNCFNEQEEFLSQFYNKTIPAVICYYSVYCSGEKWWKEVYEQ